MTDGVYSRLLKKSRAQGGSFFLLLDPDRVDEKVYIALAESAADSGVDALLVGTSMMIDSRFPQAVRQIKEAASAPVIIFPGSHAQLTPHADAVLFTTLISGRNPQYLIDEQVKGAPLVKKFGLEAIPTGYMLIESGPLTSVQYLSSTLPIPRDKPDIATAHAMAAECLGLQLLYLEAGSGAGKSVPIDMIQSVTAHTEIPVMVGGGLTSPEACAERVAAGASFIVVGNHIEQNNSHTLLKELTAAVHSDGPAQR